MFLIYPALFTYDKQENIYIVKFPDFSNIKTDPGLIITAGATLEEALKNAREALESHLFAIWPNIPAATSIKDIKKRKGFAYHIVAELPELEIEGE